MLSIYKKFFITTTLLLFPFSLFEAGKALDPITDQIAISVAGKGPTELTVPQRK